MTRASTQLLLSRRAPPVLLVLTVAAAALLHTFRAPPAIGAFAAVDAVPVTAPEDGILERLLVLPGDAVRSGQVLGTIVNADLDAEIAAMTSETSAAGARVEAAHESTDRDRVDLQVDVARAEADLAAARAEADALTALLVEARDRVSRGLLTADELVRPITEQASAEARARSLTASVSRLRATADGAAAEPAEATRARLEQDASRHRLDALGQRREGLLLRAPTDGIVSIILRAAGSTVDAGRVVMQIVPAHTSRVVACTPPALAPPMGGRATVSRPGGGLPQVATVRGIVAPADPGMSRCDPLTGSLELHVETDAPEAWIPGERLLVRLDAAEVSAR